MHRKFASAVLTLLVLSNVTGLTSLAKPNKKLTNWAQWRGPDSQGISTETHVLTLAAAVGAGAWWGTTGVTAALLLGTAGGLIPLLLSECLRDLGQS